jgi:hypothetical protein
MRTWRVGTISMGATLLLMGIGLLYAQINEQLVLDWAIHWWPVIFIFLGAEVLWQAYQAKKSDGRVAYDILSVLIIGLLLCFGLAMQALSETGVIEQCKTMLVSENYELQNTSKPILLDAGLKEVVVEGSASSLEIFSGPMDKITSTFKADITAPSRKAALKLLQESQGVEIRREGDTLYITFVSSSPVSHLSSGLSRQSYSLYLPEQLKVSIYSETNDAQIHAKNILNDWYIHGIQSVALDLPSASNLQLTAQVNSQSELQGNAGWTIKEKPSTSGENSVNEETAMAEGSLNLGTGQHKMIINSNGPVSVDLLP